MTIEKMVNGSSLTLAVKGRLDTTTAPELEAELKEVLRGITELVFDFSGLEYISSAGLRVILLAQKTMNQRGSLVVKNVGETVMGIFEMTGFCDILTIE